MREQGYYWVKVEGVPHGPPNKRKNKWEVALYEKGWLMIASIGLVSDSYFLEIDERRIERNNIKYHE